MLVQTMETLARAGGAGWVQLLLQDGGTRLPCHQFRVSCRCGIAEPSNYNFILKLEIDKILKFFTPRNRIGHQSENLEFEEGHDTYGDSRPRLSGGCARSRRFCETWVTRMGAKPRRATPEFEPKN